jgi:hypothetical protein
MMKLNVNQQRKDLSDSDILKHQDFGALLRSYELANPRVVYMRKVWVGVSVAAAAVIALVLFFSVFYKAGDVKSPLMQENKDLFSQNMSGMPDKISPPFAEFVQKAESYSLDAVRGGKITSSSGSKIIVPERAFVNTEGTTVEGKVEIRYRELQNPVDIFLSGVPTHYEAEGRTLFLQSAGMVEITAFLNDTEIDLDPGKEIKVEMNTFFPGQQDVFFYDVAENKWTDLGQDEVVAEAKPAQPKPVQTAVAVNKDTTMVPPLPRKADKQKHVINIDVELAGIPELSMYKRVIFEVNERYQKFDSRVYNVKWDKASIEHSEVPENYYLTMSMRDSSLTYLVYPVFDNKSYEQALAVYNEKRVKRDAELAMMKQQAGTQQTASATEGKVQQEIPLVEGEIRYSELRPVAKRKLTVHKLGLYNCGKPVPAPESPVIQPSFADAQGALLKDVKIYVADRSANMLYNFGQIDKITFNRNVKNLLWIVTPDGRIGILPPETFASLTKENETPAFRLNLTDAKTGIEKLKEYMHV